MGAIISIASAQPRPPRHPRTLIHASTPGTNIPSSPFYVIEHLPQSQFWAVRDYLSPVSPSTSSTSPLIVLLIVLSIGSQGKQIQRERLYHSGYGTNVAFLAPRPLTLRVPEEFVLAGDFLVYKFPVWQW